MPSPAETGHQEREEDEEKEEDTEGHSQLSKEAIHHQCFLGSLHISSHRGHCLWPAKDRGKKQPWLSFIS